MSLQIQEKLMEFKKSNPQFGSNANFGSIAEMQKFVEKYPEMTKMKDNVSKHVNLLHSLSRVVEQHNLMDLSELEQQLAVVQDHKAAFKQVSAFLADDKIRDIDKLRLVLLYSLRYEKEGMEKGTITQLSRMLPATRLPGSYISQASEAGEEESLPYSNDFAKLMLGLCGTSRRTPQSDLFNRGVNAVISQGFKGFSKGPENAYMLHEPLLMRILKNVDKAKLPEDKYPFRPSNSQKNATDNMKALKKGPAELIVFYVGGATYAESRLVAKFNEQNPHMRVVLGGTTFLTSSTFLESVAARGMATSPQ